MISMAAVAFLATNVSCKASPISEEEAKILAIRAAHVSGVPQRYILDAELDGGAPPNVFSFRVFATNPDPDSGSDLAGWFSINRWTAVLAGFDDKVIKLPAIENDQERLRMTHCLIGVTNGHRS
jgi:hypothetical protein